MERVSTLWQGMGWPLLRVWSAALLLTVAADLIMPSLSTLFRHDATSGVMEFVILLCGAPLLGTYFGLRWTQGVLPLSDVTLSLAGPVAFFALLVTAREAEAALGIGAVTTVFPFPWHALSQVSIF